MCAVRGNFDDAQTGVKRIFSDEALREELAALAGKKVRWDEVADRADMRQVVTEFLR